MPASTRGVLRDRLTFVQVSDFLAFGWNSADLSAISGISNAELNSALGHKSVGDSFAGIVKVVGANAPKPARFVKKLPNATANSRKTVSTYCDIKNYAAAVAAGWRLQKPQTSVFMSVAAAGKRTFTGVTVLSNSVWYVQPVDAVACTPEIQNVLGILTGTQITTNGRKLLVRGCRDKPGLASVPLAGGGVARLPFSAARLNNVRDAGWNIVRDEIITYLTDVVPF